MEKKGKQGGLLIISNKFGNEERTDERTDDLRRALAKCPIFGALMRLFKIKKHFSIIFSSILAKCSSNYDVLIASIKISTKFFRRF